MPAINAITPEKLARLIGLPHGPAIIDVRTDRDFAADPNLVPGSVRRGDADPAVWASRVADRSAVIVDAQGRAVSEGVAAWLRHEGIAAEILDGGTLGWAAAGLPMVPAAVLPPRDAQGRTLWVTRARSKVDRIACPWLIRRFVDPNAVFLFVSPAEVTGVAERFGAAAFDIAGEGVVWGHVGECCAFNAMVARFGLAAVPGLSHLATIVRGADTARPELAPEAAGLVALSLGLSRMFSNDLEQLDAGMLLYDALYRWCRDATGETHDWVSHHPKAVRPKVSA
ncbi:chromate resistance protein ChrB domain-containing protein [Sphingomonas glacialis]|uniref:Sulfurtransferase n=1 Tax=Sphingomonas glacialis TaxID=658225 RepID=A0A502FY90_9SPHN|nr:sulfurtransferase/chromate resistance protein [Sphingomonas glacialis]TPG54607.1 sulfurtransferase [Sphingomonas glacialis]